MRLLFGALFVSLATTNACGQESPLAKLTVTSTRLGCSTGFACVTYAYKRDTANANASQLAFVVIETSKHNPRFKSCVHLSSKVDDVTPPAYIALGDGVIDLPHDDQIHAVGEGRYHHLDGEVTLGEIRAWLDQPQMQASIKSLLDYRTQLRSTDRAGGR